MNLRDLALTFMLIQHPKTEAILTAPFTSPRTPLNVLQKICTCLDYMECRHGTGDSPSPLPGALGPMKCTTIHTECSNEPRYIAEFALVNRMLMHSLLQESWSRDCVI